MSVVSETQLGWKVSDEIIESFKQYCDTVGGSYKSSIAASMVIWKYLPPSIQRMAQLEASGEDQLDEEFWKEYTRGLEDAILGHERSPDRNK